MTVSYLTLIYSSNFPHERLFLFDRSNIRQNYWVRAVVALLCLRSCATRKRANGPCFSYSAEETLAWSIFFVFRSRYSTVLSCYIHQLCFSTSKQIRRGEMQQESGALLLLFLCQSARGKLNHFGYHNLDPPWSIWDSCFRKAACLDLIRR